MAHQEKTGKSEAAAAPIPKDQKHLARKQAGKPAPPDGGEGATGMQPGAGHPRGR